MVIGFKKQFVPKIKSGKKIHTIRRDEHNRWKVGRSIQMATGVRTKHYKQFHTAKCISIQKIFFNWGLPGNFLYQILRAWAKEGNVKMPRISKKKLQMPLMSNKPNVFVDDKMLSKKQVLHLAKNDGFKNSQELFNWFNQDFEGKIIHWAKKKY